MSTTTGNPGPLPVDAETFAENARAAFDRVLALLERAERERDEAIRQRDEASQKAAIELDAAYARERELREARTAIREKLRAALAETERQP